MIVHQAGKRYTWIHDTNIDVIVTLKRSAPWRNLNEAFRGLGLSISCILTISMPLALSRHSIMPLRMWAILPCARHTQTMSKQTNVNLLSYTTFAGVTFRISSFWECRDQLKAGAGNSYLWTCFFSIRRIHMNFPPQKARIWRLAIKGDLRVTPLSQTIKRQYALFSQK